MSPDSTLMFLHTCGELTASLAHIGAGTLRTRDSIHDILYTTDEKRAINSLKKDCNITILPADKGGAKVVLDTE